MKLFISAVASAVALVGYSNGTFAATESFAVVSDAGSLVRGLNATSARRLSTGNYTVKFNASVKNCAFIASLGSTSASSTQPTGQAGAGLDPSNNKTAHVETTSSDGTDSDRSFDLVVICP